MFAETIRLHLEGKRSNLPAMPENKFFQIDYPDTRQGPFVFNSPHSGRDYPLQFVSTSRLDSLSLRRSEDFLVDELFAAAPLHGVPMLKARFPRAWLDVNREPYELDPAMFDKPLPAFANTRSARVTNGLGTIARIVAENEEIYAGPLDTAEALARIDRVYKPYHAALRGLLAETIVEFGYGILVDCHSMPSAHAVSRIGAIPFPGRRSEPLRADFVLGDRYGSACSPVLTHLAANILRDLGYRVAVNKPYAGGFITEHYGRPVNGLHALQIEVNRALYMDEARLEKSPNFAPLASDIEAFVSRLLADTANEHTHAFAASTPLAAE